MASAAGAVSTRRCSSCATSTPATGRSARSSACRSRCRPAACSHSSARTAAGKTTIARVCSGSSPDSGQVLFEGADVTGWKPFRFAQLGIVHAPEGRSVFASLTVEENLELTFRRTRGRAGVKAGLDEAYELFPRLGERRTQLAGTLSGGEQRMLSLARVLVEKPRLLIADELSLGLARSSSTRCTARSRRSVTRAPRCSSSSSTCTTRSRSPTMRS